MMFPRRGSAFKKDVQGNFLRFFESIPQRIGGYARVDPADQVGKVIGLVDYENTGATAHRPGCVRRRRRGQR